MSRLLHRMISKILGRPEGKVQFLTRLRNLEFRKAQLAGKISRRLLGRGNRALAKDWARRAVKHLEAAETYHQWLRKAA